MTTKLCFNRVECNKTITNHPTVQVYNEDNKNNKDTVGLIGILNGIFGFDKEIMMGPIQAIVDDKDTNYILKFKDSRKK